MTLVDREGRLFGRLNLVDGLLLTLALGLMPLGFAAYRLFRVPPPLLTAVEPASLALSGDARVSVRGQNLRPYMRVSFDFIQGRSFQFEDPTRAVVELREMPPGVYDVVLYDQSRERARLPKALTILPPPNLPTVRLVVVGTLADLEPEQARQLLPGQTLPGAGEVLQVGHFMPGTARARAGQKWVEIPDEQGRRLPLALLTTCTLGDLARPNCGAFGERLEPNTLAAVDTAFGRRPFLIDEVRSPAPLEVVRVGVRFSGDPGALSQISVGDVDMGVVANELAARSTVVAAGAVSRRSSEEGTRDVDLTVQAQRSEDHWAFAGQPLRIGASFALRTSIYELRGQVIALSPRFVPDSKGSPR